MTGSIPAEALWYTAPKACDIRQAPLPGLKEGEVLVRTKFSAISRGTERLVFEGKVPPSETQRMKAPFQEGDFPFPVKYGYACTGEVIDGPPALVGRLVFCLHPHQTRFISHCEKVVLLPDTVSPRRGVLAANMETALNALWDGKPSPADQICVVGAGVVGLLTAYLCAGIPGTTVTVVDTNPKRMDVVEALGGSFCLPENTPRDQDLVFHASATSAGLETALKSAGKGASVIELSWYGDQPVQVPLGADFHSRRLVLKSSQVGTVPAERQERWSYKRRLSAAINLLADPVIEQLLTHEVLFHALPRELPHLLSRDTNALAPLISYPD